MGVIAHPLDRGVRKHHVPGVAARDHVFDARLLKAQAGAGLPFPMIEMARARVTGSRAVSAILPPAALRTFRSVALLGLTFSTDELLAVSGYPEDDTYDQLELALAGLVVGVVVVLMIGLGKLDLFIGVSLAVLLSSLCVFSGALLGGLKQDSSFVQGHGTT